MNLRVKEICKSKGLLMEDLAGKLGVTPNTLTRNVNGNPTVGTLERIASALNVPITELFDQPETDNTVNCPSCGTQLRVTKK